MPVAQAAGLVMRGGRNGDKAPAPTFNIEDRSHSRNGRYFDKEFERELEILIMAADFGGSFTVRVLKKVKGSAHTKGLRIGTPNGHGGVTITWHPPKLGNDYCFEAVLLAPRGMEPFAFRQRLIQAQNNVQDDDDADDEVPAEATNDVSSVTEVISLPVSNTKRSPFSRDDGVLLLSTLCSEGRVDHDGNIARRTVLEALGEEFGYESKARGPIMRKLFSEKLVSETQDPDMVHVSEVILSEVRKEEQPDVLAFPSESPKKEAQELSLSGKLSKLRRQASISERLKGRRKEVQKRLETLGELMKSLINEDAELREELDKIDRKLGEPDLKNAEDRYAEILKILGD